MTARKPATAPLPAAERGEREQRKHTANVLIELIALHGRRFFFHSASGRTARLELDPAGGVWLVDEYSGKRIDTRSSGQWPGFSHGGTLRDLVIAVAKYVTHGERLHPDWIAPSRNDPANGNLWGYEGSAAVAVRAACAALPIIQAFEKEAA